jgi:hypothetical protein
MNLRKTDLSLRVAAFAIYRESFVATTLDGEIKKMFDLRAEQKCPFCKTDTLNARFKDDLSREEFKISGLCQECQDKFFDDSETA